MTNEVLKQKIMTRVRRVYYLKQILSPLLVKVYAIVAMFIGGVYLVSLQNVLVNLSNVSSLGQLYSFVHSAFFNTELAVQTLVLATLILVVLMVRDILKTPMNLEGRVLTS